MKKDSDESTGNDEKGATSQNKNLDLQDSPRDVEKLRPDETTMDLPEVSDIPGQEHIKVPVLGEFADTTISSDDEEGVGILDDPDEDYETEIKMGTEADITTTEHDMLEKTDRFQAITDAGQLRSAALDNTDFEGEVLNEGSFGEVQTAVDLDVPISETDDANENIGNEDEENNSYSLGSASNDEVVEGTP